jgi:hypothetical protein
LAIMGISFHSFMLYLSTKRGLTSFKAYSADQT